MLSGAKRGAKKALWKRRRKGSPLPSAVCCALIDLLCVGAWLDLDLPPIASDDHIYFEALPRWVY
jgi:hypothetical protein